MENLKVKAKNRTIWIAMNTQKMLRIERFFVFVTDAPLMLVKTRFKTSTTLADVGGPVDFVTQNTGEFEN